MSEILFSLFLDPQLHSDKMQPFCCMGGAEELVRVKKTQV